MNELDAKRPGGGTATRRTVLAGVAAAPGVALLSRLGARLRRHAGAVRPAADGTSAHRCAVCGASSHTMLSCPTTPTVV